MDLTFFAATPPCVFIAELMRHPIVMDVPEEPKSSVHVSGRAIEHKVAVTYVEVI